MVKRETSSLIKRNVKTRRNKDVKLSSMPTAEALVIKLRMRNRRQLRRKLR